MIIHPPHMRKRCIPGSSALPQVSHLRYPRDLVKWCPWVAGVGCAYMVAIVYECGCVLVRVVEYDSDVDLEVEDGKRV